MAAPSVKKVKPGKQAYLAAKDESSKHYILLADAVSDECPTLATFYMYKSKLSYSTDKDDKNKFFERCPYCLSRFSPSSATIRLLPKPSLNRKIQRLLNRQTTHPGSLGKFQNKLVQDYVNGRNVVTIKCNVCKKTRKLPAQSRMGQLKQREYLERQTVENTGSEDVMISVRKQKRKERKKLMKMKKKAGEIDEDINAGLTMTAPAATTTTTSILGSDDRTDYRLNREEGVNIHQNSLNKPSKNIEEQNFRKSGTSNISLHKSRSDKLNEQIVKIQTNISNKTQKNINVQLSMVDKQRIGGFVQTNGVKKGSEKKNKSKKMSQRLGNILKREQRKEAGGTLTDFLSSL